MASSSDEKLSLIAKLEAECAREKETVEHIRGLLAKADRRRLAEPQNIRRWNRVLDNLETALHEAKLRLEHCETALKQARKAESEEFVPNSSRNGQPSSTNTSSQTEEPQQHALPAQPGFEDAAAAAQAILQAPLDAVENAPLEQVALARSYLAWRKRDGSTNGEEKRLAGRIELAIQGRARNVASTSLKERRHQHMLRAAVDKIVSNRIDSMTFRELELVVSSYSVLLQRPDRLPSEDRMISLLGRAIAEMERLLSELPPRT